MEQTFAWPLPNGFHPNNMVRIRGTIPQGGRHFNINFQTQNEYNASDIIFHVSIRHGDGVIILNSKDNGRWLAEERGNTLAVAAGREFEIVIACEPNLFRIAVNGLHFADFRMRRTHRDIRALSVIGVVDLSAVSFESSIAAMKLGSFGTPYPFPR